MSVAVRETDAQTIRFAWPFGKARNPPSPKERELSFSGKPMTEWPGRWLTSSLTMVSYFKNPMKLLPFSWFSWKQMCAKFPWRRLTFTKMTLEKLQEKTQNKTWNMKQKSKTWKAVYLPWAVLHSCKYNIAVIFFSTFSVGIFLCFLVACGNVLGVCTASQSSIISRRLPDCVAAQQIEFSHQRRRFSLLTVWPLNPSTHHLVKLNCYFLFFWALVLLPVCYNLQKLTHLQQRSKSLSVPRGLRFPGYYLFC